MKVVVVPPNIKQDFITELVIEGLRDLNCEIFSSDRGNGLRDNEVYSDDDIVHAANTADAVLFFFGKVKGNMPPKHYLLDRLQDRSRCAYIDGSEWSSTGYQEKNQAEVSIIDPSKRRGKDWIRKDMLEKCAYYFKRECYPEDAQLGLIPLPFGLLKRNIPFANFETKDIDVSCIFGHTLTGLRKETMQVCEQIKNENPNYKVVVSNRLSPEEYSSAIARSKVVVDAWGGGDSCNRFYEAVGAKSCCLYQRYNTIVPNEYVDMKHAVSYSTIEDFDKKLKLLLSNPQLTNQIGKDGYTHANQHHSAKARAEFILRTIAGDR